ncbi:MAG: DEAD/DEAH box helicase [Treponema sp.]|jgi:ATP-dependent Lhr-like helicase|nr:DEAD/DEAH box helicase [Treponema sp.]
MPLPFHPLINAWFTETYGKPTPVQEEAWPVIARGEHVLALAPTGSGKTLTGFLAAVSRFADGTYDAGRLSVLYVSPLKALNEDIRRNLTGPLEAIRGVFERAGAAFPAIRVETRSGDTPQYERRRFLARPPSILALTPESLGIILLNPRGRQALSQVRYLILDEIHTAIGTKRGAFLSCQVDRLALTAGEFQRVALSATVQPPEAAADFAGGLVKTRRGGYEKRKVQLIAPVSEKKITLSVEFPEDAAEKTGAAAERYGRRYAVLIRFIMERIKANRTGARGSVLVFTDSRRRAERITYLLNQAFLSGNPADFFPENPEAFMGRNIAYTHHGSLSKDVRRTVEKGLAEGEIPCVVATGSLELGIDIGSVDEVVLAGSPGSSAQTLQRVGRSGHGVGMTSRGCLVPFHGLDLLQAAAVAGAVEDREFEETRAVEGPLDILAQIVLGLCAEKDRNEDELYETLKGFYVYRNLSRPSYDGVIRMLAGAYEGTRLRELKRRIFRDDVTGTLTAAPGALQLLYSSGGVIASRGYYSLRLAPGTEGAGTKIGELDEEFVWERRLGDSFDFGSRSWRITAIGSEAVEVVPLPHGADYQPFWKADSVYRSPVLCRRTLEILDRGNSEPLTSVPGFSPEALKSLEDFLSAQKAAQGKLPLPGPAFIPIEVIDDPIARGDAYSVIFHTFRGGTVNYPLSMALARDMEAEYGLRVEAVPDDNGILLRLPRSIAADPGLSAEHCLRRLCRDGTGEKRFRERLESSGVFGAAFREAAERSLLLPRAPFGKRIPLWVLRQKSKRLFDAVSSYRDFPETAEAWRTCLNETFDMKGFASLLDDIAAGAVGIGCFKTRRPSPFSQELAWAENNVLMYEYDPRPDLMGPPGARTVQGSLSDQVIAEALGNPGARPPLQAELTADFCSRLRREKPGWAPEDPLTLCEWVKERIAIPTNNRDEEWEELLNHVPPELKEAVQQDPGLGGRLAILKRESAGVASVVHREWAKRWREGGPGELAEDCLRLWLRYEGPVPLSRITEVFGFSMAEAEDAVYSFVEAEELADDVIVTQGDVPARAYSGAGLVCDRENLELLLRLLRRKRRREVKEKPAPLLVPFLARRQGLLQDSAPAGFPQRAEGGPWKKLSGFTAQAKLWETEIFPCRQAGYSGETLDRELREGRLLWYGAGKEKAGFCEPGDIDLVLPGSPAPEFTGGFPQGFFDFPRSFWEIRDAFSACARELEGTGNAACAAALWNEAWRGSLSADSWEPVRRGLENGFFPSGEKGETAGAKGSVTGMGIPGSRRISGTLRIPKAIRERWRSGPPVPGNWFALFNDDGQRTEGEEFRLLEEEELNRDRVRILLDRWGVLCRPFLEREAPCFSWSHLLPAMRRMELAGELTAGRFFSGINSLQFASPHIAEELEQAEQEQGVYWMNAADPASPSGLSIEGLEKPGREFPNRLPSSRLCFRGAELLAVSNRGARDLLIFIPPDDPAIMEAMAFVKLPRLRAVQPEIKVVIEKINGKTAASGEYAEVFRHLGFVNDRGMFVLW